MLSSVDLPLPDAPTHRGELAVRDDEVEPLQGLDLHPVHGCRSATSWSQAIRRVRTERRPAAAGRGAQLGDVSAARYVIVLTNPQCAGRVPRPLRRLKCGMGQQRRPP